MTYIAGKGNKTDESFFLKQNLDQSKTLVFTQTNEGDESVTWKKGIPQKLIELEKVYYAQCVHGELANDPKLFDAIEELLEYGTTKKLEQRPASLRNANINKPSSTDLSFDLSPRGVEATILGLSDEKLDDENDKYLETIISNGDLKYAKFPILSGHFKNDGIVNGEKAIDWNLKGILSIRNELNLYPEEVGTNELFLTDCDGKESIFDFKGAIIVKSPFFIVNSVPIPENSPCISWLKVEYSSFEKTSSGVAKAFK